MYIFRSVLGFECCFRHLRSYRFCQRESQGKMSTTSVAAQGWQCPLCKYVYSPTFPSCLNCNKPLSTAEGSGILQGNQQSWTIMDGIYKPSQQGSGGTGSCSTSGHQYLIESDRCSICGQHRNLGMKFT